MAVETDKTHRAVAAPGNGKKELARAELLNPFLPLAALRREMDRVFESFLGGFPTLNLNVEGILGMPRTFSPEVSVKETEKEIRVTAELPGMQQKDITVEVVGSDLILSGEKKEEKEEKDEGWRSIERRYGAFRRVIALSPDVDREKVTAKYKDGVLTITVQKKPEAQPLRKKVEIH